MRIDELFVNEGKVKLYTDPGYFGAEVDDTGFDSLPVVNISADMLVGFEPDSKMNQTKSQANVEKIVAGLKKGNKLPPLLVRKYKDGYQVLDGHHRFWAYKLLGTKNIPVRIVADKDIEEISKPGVTLRIEDVDTVHNFELGVRSYRDYDAYVQHAEFKNGQELNKLQLELLTKELYKEGMMHELIDIAYQQG